MSECVGWGGGGAAARFPCSDVWPDLCRKTVICLPDESNVSDDFYLQGVVVISDFVISTLALKKSLNKYAKIS